MNHRATRTAAILMGLAVAISASVLAMASTRSRPARPTLPFATTTTAGSSQALLTRHFRVLRRPAAAAARVPGSRVATSRPYGIDPARGRLARTVAVGSRDAAFVITPGSAGICVSSTLMGDLCVPADKATVQGGIGFAQCGNVPAGMFAIYGLLPDDAVAPGAGLRLVLRSGAVMQPSVKNNVLFALLGTDTADVPKTIEWNSAASGRHVVALPIPYSQLRDPCEG
jgi:hypothetical protein